MEELGQWGPPYVALGWLIWGIWKGAKWLAWRLFDDTTGLVTLWFRAQQHFQAQQTAATVALAASVKDTTSMVELLQRRMDRVIAATHDQGEQQHLIDVLIDDSPVPMAMTAEGGDFIRTNEAFEDLLGYTRGELAGLSWQEVTPNHCDVDLDAETSRSIAAGLIQREKIEKYFRRKDGTTVYVALHIRRFPRQGTFRHFVTIAVPLQSEHRLR